MPKKLSLVLRGNTSRSALKAAIFGLFVFLAAAGWPLTVIFIVAAAYFYFQPFSKTRPMLSSFLILLVVSLLFVFYPFNEQWPLRLAVVLILSFLFFLLLGIKNLIFVHRQPLYHLFNNSLMFLVFVAFFLSDKSNFFALKYLLAGLAIFLLWHEAFRFALNLGQTAANVNLLAAGFTFLNLQFFWAVALLPLGFLNSSALLLAMVLVMKESAIHHLNGTLNRQGALKNIIIFIASIVVIFAASRWRP